MSKLNNLKFQVVYQLFKGKNSQYIDYKFYFIKKNFKFTEKTKQKTNRLLEDCRATDVNCTAEKMQLSDIYRTATEPESKGWK